MTNAEANPAAAVAEPGAPDAPAKASTKKGASPKKGATKGQKAVKAAKRQKAAKPKKVAAKPARKQASTPRAASKGAKILEMIGRAKGASLAEIMEATGWQRHSVRGFLSGTVGKKLGLQLESDKNEAGERIYRLAK